MNILKTTALSSLILTGASAVSAQENPIFPDSVLNPQQPPATVEAPLQVEEVNPVAQNDGFPVAPSVMPETMKVPLSFKEQRGVDLANQWKNRPELPREGPDGAVTYLYGASLPTLVCTPLVICTIQLEPGEIVEEGGVHAGDTARWRISPAAVGSGKNLTTVVVVKPTEAGLRTNLLITSDRRVYSIKLISDPVEWMPTLAFDYPANLSADWAAYNKKVAGQKKAAAASAARKTIPRTGGQRIDKLDFNYRISGAKTPWRPVRVYTDGRKTYIQFPSGSFPDGAPALVSLAKGGKAVMVNYRLKGDRYEVDRVLYNAELVVGTGRHQERVKIKKVGS